MRRAIPMAVGILTLVHLAGCSLALGKYHTVSVHGQLVNAANRQPIENARAVLELPNLASAEIPLGFSDAQGNFHGDGRIRWCTPCVLGIPVHRERYYTRKAYLSVTADGYDPATFPIDLRQHETANGDFATTVETLELPPAETH